MLKNLQTLMFGDPTVGRIEGAPSRDGCSATRQETRACARCCPRARRRRQDRRRRARHHQRRRHHLAAEAPASHRLDLSHRDDGKRGTAQRHAGGGRPRHCKTSRADGRNGRTDRGHPHFSVQKTESARHEARASRCGGGASGSPYRRWTLAFLARSIASMMMRSAPAVSSQRTMVTHLPFSRSL